MSDNKSLDGLHLMLGQIHSDVKWLVEERRSTTRRMDEIERGIELKVDEHDERLRRLEGFKIRIGVVTAILGTFVPIAITVAAKMAGLL